MTSKVVVEAERRYFEAEVFGKDEQKFLQIKGLESEDGLVIHTEKGSVSIDFFLVPKDLVGLLVEKKTYWIRLKVGKKTPDWDTITGENPFDPVVRRRGHLGKLNAYFDCGGGARRIPVKV